LHGSEIRTQVRRLQTKYPQIIVDVGGRDTGSLRAALTVAHILVLPVLPATFDIWSLEPLQAIVEEAREINSTLSVIAVLNAADPQGRDNDEAAAIIRDTAGFQYFERPIVRRKAFRNAVAAGLSILEYRPEDRKAVAEFTLLDEQVFGYHGEIGTVSYGDHEASVPKY
jgi:chromosome partitioning protein